MHGRLLGHLVRRLFTVNSRATNIFNRDNVESLIKHVPDARYKGFSTHSAAAEHYFEAKKALKVKVVRNPGDEMKYGPMGSAAQ